MTELPSRRKVETRHGVSLQIYPWKDGMSGFWLVKKHNRGSLEYAPTTNA